jgi:hypothetical protein
MPASLLERAVSHYGLTERQAGVVVEYCKKGNLASACRAVGYDYTEAQRLLSDNPGFQAAVSEYIQGLYLSDRVRARQVILKMMEKAESERVRLDAAKWLDERAAGKAAEHHVHEHYVTSDRAAIMVEIRRLATELRLGEEIEMRLVQIAAPELPTFEPAVDLVSTDTGRRRAPEAERPVGEPQGGPPALPEAPADE